MSISENTHDMQTLLISYMVDFFRMLFHVQCVMWGEIGCRLKENARKERERERENGEKHIQYNDA
mgnify:FL=1